MEFLFPVSVFFSGSCQTCAWSQVTVASVPSDALPFLQYDLIHTTTNPLCTHAHPHTQPQQTLISLLCCLLYHSDLRVARAYAFSSPPLLSMLQHRRGESSAARKKNKTMESVKHSKANGFTAASSPPSLFMCKSIHRVLMAPAMHDTDSFKWPSKNKK